MNYSIIYCLEFYRTKLSFFVKDITLHFVKFVRMFISIKNYDVFFSRDTKERKDGTWGRRNGVSISYLNIRNAFVIIKKP